MQLQYGQPFHLWKSDTDMVYLSAVWKSLYLILAYASVVVQAVYVCISSVIQTESD